MGKLSNHMVSEMEGKRSNPGRESSKFKDLSYWHASWIKNIQGGQSGSSGEGKERTVGHRQDENS